MSSNKKSANHITASKHATHQQSVSGIESRLLTGDPGTPMITITTEHYGTSITSAQPAPALVTQTKYGQIIIRW